MLTLSCLTPASSLFVLVPGLLATQGTGAVMTLLTAVVLCVAVAFCYSELGTLAPSSGGEYAMVGTVAGRLTGWLVFVVSLLVVLVVPPVMALGTAEYLAPVWTVDSKFLGALVMVLSVCMGLLHLRTNAWVTGAFMVLEIGAAAVVAILGFTHRHQQPGVLFHPQVVHDNMIQPFTVGLLISGLAMALFVLQGFSSAVYLAEEMRDPRRTVARTVLWTLAVGALVLIVPTVAITLGAPDLSSLADGDLMGMIAEWSSSPFATVIGACVALAIVNASIVMVIQNSRILFASARDRAWPVPVNRAFGRINARGAPWVATLVVGIPGAALCFADLTLLNQVTSVVIASLYLIVAVGALGGRRARHRDVLAWRMPLWPAVPCLVIIALVYVLTQQPVVALLVPAGVLCAATLYWALYLRPRPLDRWVITIPDE
ncbi:APC family permease [Nocardia sp. NPDC056100]|uniref:APC family permease n=1 Tax=Nocardia sp. NPDC056100 TaxID=3345712 RepID=UPI0035DB4025